MPSTAARSASGALSIGGVDLVELAEEYGTPLFLYDEVHLQACCKQAVAAFGPGVAYGTKAFLCKAMASLAANEGMHLDVATGGELAVALAAGVAPERLVLHGNNKSDEELATAVSKGIGRIVVDSFDEIRRLSRILSSRVADPVKVLIRVTPGVHAHTHEYVMTGQEDSKFGFSLSSGAADDAASAIRQVAGAELVGAHAHVGSQIFRTDVYAKEVAAVVPFVRRHGLGEFCVGGGLGVAYVNHEHAPSLAEWAAVVHTACAEAGMPAGVRVTAEPGRVIVATAGMTLYRVGTVKRLEGLSTYVSVDGGMSDNPRPVLYGSGYEAFLPRCPDAPRTQPARVVGKHCESGDVIVERAMLPEDLEIGDLLATPVTGAYGYAMASNYNRVGRPPVLFVKDGHARVVVRRETIEDLLSLEP
ncbi:MAG: diaminopimelate decarboxylase [Acidimicrobiales bacterium]